MNVNIKRLAEIASKPERKIIGLMSGTSMDGLDIAVCLCRGSGDKTHVNVLKFITVLYDEEFRNELKSVFSKRDTDLQQICLLNEWVGIKHADMILNALQEWNINPQDIDLIASHGQTIFHAPKSLHGLKNYPNGTLQIGDGDHIAVKTGIITISDFRQKHLAAGGEGAPLSVYGDYLIFSKTGENCIMLNIGGIANFTFLPADSDAGKVFSTDVGPGNTLMDQFVQKHYPGLYFDDDAALAKAGKVNEELLKELKEHPFFKLNFPKTTGPELFNLNYLKEAQKRSNTSLIPKEAILATLCRFSAEGITEAINHCFTQSDNVHIYLSGGGIHNPLLLEEIKRGLPYTTFATSARLGINPDAKEAVLFALLANESVAGGVTNFGKRTDVPSVCMGKISMPY